MLNCSTQLKLMRPVTDETQSVDRTIHQEIVSTFLCIKIRPYFNHQEFQCHLHCCYSKHQQVLHCTVAGGATGAPGEEVH